MKIGIEFERNGGTVRIWFPLHHYRLVRRTMQGLDRAKTPFKLLFTLRTPQ